MTCFRTCSISPCMSVFMFSRSLARTPMWVQTQTLAKRRSRARAKEERRVRKQEGRGCGEEVEDSCDETATWAAGRKPSAGSGFIVCRGGQKPSGGGLWQVGSCSSPAPARPRLSLPLPPPHPQSHPASPRSDRLHPLGESPCPRMRQAVTYCAHFPILTGLAPSRGRRVASR